MSREAREGGSGPDDLPRLALIADGFSTGRRAPGGMWVPGDAVRRRAIELVRAGVRWVHLRDHAASDAAFGDAALGLVLELAQAATQNPLWLSVNTRTGLVPALQALVPEARVGAHLGRRGPAVHEAGGRLGPGVPLGISAHSPEDVQTAFQSGARYVFYSPIFATATHLGAEPAGLKALKQVCAVASGPVLALGGVTPVQVAGCLQAGAHGVAVLSALLDAADPRAALDRFRAHLPNLAS